MMEKTTFQNIYMGLLHVSGRKKCSTVCPLSSTFTKSLCIGQLSVCLQGMSLCFQGMSVCLQEMSLCLQGMSVCL